MENNRQKGKVAEKKAIDFLLNKGYSIIATNYQKKFGEIDIIAKKDTYIFFVEVKYRKNIDKGYPREAVSRKKQEKIKATALCYITENNLTNVDFCFDVIEIIGDNIIHIESAFY
ncbi:YraN family protein [[Clostridium] colinum]|uniref:YraN family protein n=1 Tax=[Clostridium] colinum TaxID=36835 RepID=UPI002025AFEA|nr:YraN family protein [[Clostridium] colinum]